MRIVVFGAGGFVGAWVCEELLRRRVDVVPVVRNWASAVRLARHGVDVRRADIEDLNECSEILAGAEAIINVALPPPTREPELVSALYAECARRGVRRFIQFSSAAVYGNQTGHIDESAPTAPIDDYSRGKAEMENRLLQAVSGTTPQLIVLRPSIIYGPFSENWTVRYVQRIRKGRWRGLGSVGNGTCNLVHAHDVAKAAVAAATVDIPPGAHVLNINGPDVVTWNEYIERLGDVLGGPNRFTPSAVRLRGMAFAGDIMRRANSCGSVRSLGKRSTGTIRAAMKQAQAAAKLYPSLKELSLLGRRAHYSSKRAAQVLGLNPSIPLDDGLRQSVAWCRLHGIV